MLRLLVSSSFIWLLSGLVHTYRVVKVLFLRLLDTNSCLCLCLQAEVTQRLTNTRDVSKVPVQRTHEDLAKKLQVNCTSWVIFYCSSQMCALSNSSIACPIWWSQVFYVYCKAANLSAVWIQGCRGRPTSELKLLRVLLPGRFLSCRLHLCLSMWCKTLFAVTSSQLVMVIWLMEICRRNWSGMQEEKLVPQVQGTWEAVATKVLGHLFSTVTSAGASHWLQVVTLAVHPVELKLLQTMGQAGMGRPTAMVQFHNLHHMDLVHAWGRWRALLAPFIFRSISPIIFYIWVWLSKRLFLNLSM